MDKTTVRFLRSCVFLVVLATIFASPSFIFAQYGVGSGSNPESEDRKEPYRLKMSGFLNTKPEEGSLGLITLGISTFSETYKFDVGSVEAPDYPQLSSSAVLRQVGRYSVDFNLIGPRELLSKIGQAEPGTPLALSGFFTPYNRTLRLESVQIIGMDKY
ncbi:MAG: hypothetical protein AB7P69_14205 [Candidatus Binatia bacterium]